MFLTIVLTGVALRFKFERGFCNRHLHAEGIRIHVIVISDSFVPDIIGPGVGGGRDGCGILFRGFGFSAEGILHFAAVCFSGSDKVL